MNHDHHRLDGSPGTALIGQRNLKDADVRALIDYFEQRLDVMGEQGDCAYERAMGTVYQQLLSQLRQRLPAPEGCA